MAVVRVNKTKDYTIMSNYHLKQKGMTLKAKGLLSLMLSLPDNWDYSIAGLVAICEEKESAINSILKELKEFGYLTVEKKLPNETETGRIEYVYNIYEKPTKPTAKQHTEKQGIEKQGVENQGVEFQGVEIQGVEIQALENQVQLNTKELNTKELNTNKSKTNNVKKERKETFDELIANYTCNEELKTELKNHLMTRKSKKATLTNRAIELSFKKLDELTAGVPVNEAEAEKIKIVQQSIERGWIGFFELQKPKSYGKKQSDGWSYIDNEFEKVMQNNVF